MVYIPVLSWEFLFWPRKYARASSHMNAFIFSWCQRIKILKGKWSWRTRQHCVGTWGHSLFSRGDFLWWGGRQAFYSWFPNMSHDIIYYENTPNLLYIFTTPASCFIFDKFKIGLCNLLVLFSSTNGKLPFLKYVSLHVTIEDSLMLQPPLKQVFLYLFLNYIFESTLSQTDNFSFVDFM